MCENDIRPMPIMSNQRLRHKMYCIEGIKVDGMKVLLLSMDPIFVNDIAWGFESLGHVVMSKQPALPAEYDQLVKQFEPELIMTLGSPSYYRNIELLMYIGNRQGGGSPPLIHWDTDGITWRDLELDFIRTTKPDFVFTVCPEMLDVLKENPTPSAMLPYAFSPETHFQGSKNIEYGGMITFVGNAYSEMVCARPDHLRTRSIAALIKPLLQNDERVDFWGDTGHAHIMRHMDCYVPNAWLHGPCPYRKTYEIYGSCFINIVPQNHEHHLTKRTYEILGSGGFILTFDTPEIRQWFTPGKEMEMSASPEQTLEIVDYYRKNPDTYNRVRENALLAAQSHTYRERAACIVERINAITR